MRSSALYAILSTQSAPERASEATGVLSTACSPGLPIISAGRPCGGEWAGMTGGCSETITVRDHTRRLPAWHAYAWARAVRSYGIHGWSAQWPHARLGAASRSMDAARPARAGPVPDTPTPPPAAQARPHRHRHGSLELQAARAPCRAPVRPIVSAHVCARASAPWWRGRGARQQQSVPVRTHDGANRGHAGGVMSGAMRSQSTTCAMARQCAFGARGRRGATLHGAEVTAAGAATLACHRTAILGRHMPA